MSKWVMWGSRDLFLEFWDTPTISRTVEARNFKFCTETAAESSNKKMQNYVKRAHVGVT